MADKNDRQQLKNEFLQFARQRIRKHAEDEGEDLHQQLMNEAYDEWQKHKEWSKTDFMDSLDDIHREAVALGNMNYQVQNGGWEQWHDNGYSFQFDLVDDVLEKIGTRTSTEARRILGQVMEIIEQMGGARSGGFEFGGDEDETMDLREQLDEFDDQYYEIDDQLMKDAEEYFQIQKRSNAPADRGRPDKPISVEEQRSQEPKHTQSSNPEWQDYFDYLDDLRESGRTNMFGAPQYLQQEMGLDKKESMAVFQAWSHAFGKEPTQSSLVFGGHGTVFYTADKIREALSQSSYWGTMKQPPVETMVELLMRLQTQRNQLKIIDIDWEGSEDQVVIEFDRPLTADESQQFAQYVDRVQMLNADTAVRLWLEVD